MAFKVDQLLLDVLEADPETPVAGQIWCGPNGLGPKATTTVPGVMSITDKTKLDNMSANGSGDDWISGLLVEAQVASNQTVKYTSGTYMVNGVLYSIASGGNYDLTNGFGGVNHYAALSGGQRAIVLIYVDTAQVIKSVAGAPSSSNSPPMPTIPNDVVCLAFVLIGKKSNGDMKNITPPDVTDCRLARRASVDEAVKISATDTVSGFLGDKLTNNGNITFTKENADANETLKASVTALGITDAHVAAANKDGVVGTASMRTIGTGALQACAGNHNHANGTGTAVKLVETSGPTDLAVGIIADGHILKRSGSSVIGVAAGAGTDELVKATAADTTSGYLHAKLAAGNGIALSTLNPSGNEQKQIAVSMSSSEATATDSPTTNSTNYVLMTGMTLTPGAGTYLVLFSTSVSSSASNGEVLCCLYANSVQIAATESRTSQFKAGDIVEVAINKVVTVAAAQAIEVKWKVVSGTGTARARVLTLLKIA